jgi:3-dehydroquinate synthase
MPTGAPYAESEVCRQQFAVRYAYDLVFTRRCFDPQNSALARAMGVSDASPRPRCVVFLDLGLVERRADLAPLITSYFRRLDTPILAAPPIVLPGGETIKNEAHYIARMHDAILDDGIDRHSYVIAVAAARCSTPWGSRPRPLIAACGSCARRPQCQPKTMAASA